MYVCVRCVTVRAVDCRVACGTEESGLVKSRNSVIVTIERWRVRSSLFDLLASCSAILTIIILFIFFAWISSERGLVSYPSLHVKDT